MSHARLDRRQAGAAFAEALLVLPILALLYVATLHMHRVQASVLSARGEARACAWRYSNAGCHGGPPPGCENTSPISDDIDDPNDGERSMWRAAMAVVSLRWAFEGLFGRSVTMRATRTVKAPPVFGAKEIHLASQLYLLCNERNRTAKEIAKDTACSVISSDSYLHDVLGCKGSDPWD